MQNYVEFDGGGDRIKIQGEQRAWDASAKKSAALQKISTFRYLCPQGDVLEISLQRAYHI